MTKKPHFDAWEEEHRHVRWTEARNLPEIKSFLRDNSKILDVGCGKGRYCLPLSKDHELYGTDISIEALRNLRKKSEGRDISLPLFHSSATHIPFKDNSFNAAICTGVLQHLLENERTEAAGEISRILKPEGILFFEAFGRGDFRYGGEEVEPHTFSRKNCIIYHYFTKEELKELFSGFEFIDLKEEKREKNFHGNKYSRHSISFVARKLV
ncbi:ubiquinone/menaquinone biosynthesis C-methylase UbiE [Methanohalophilus levihalophilus]|uniref:class I SAM-dependent methyltransferase n=1 Tax=Methanohalophilus levihalophilus TaxID=1431282 RepID=UPI001AEB92FD|nr:class I SAM-dependent methyltransferase [Methanohalophilus levihalophilus]MBP2030601.1 ubiquinone/menaquinone biosynthesis C-methylase UbiE [Methanohalophilus levihalophilus]